MNVRPGGNLHANMQIGSNINPGGLNASFTTSGNSFRNEAFRSAAISKMAGTNPQVISAKSSTSSLQGITAGLNTATSAVSSGLMSSGIGTPIGLAMEASKAVGNMISTGLASSETQDLNQQYARNLAISNSTGTQYADSVRLNAQQKLESASSGASMGAAFGPIGALVGWFAGKATAKEVPTYQANSFSGGVNPVQVSNSANSATNDGINTE